ncbi:MAG: aspartate--tRNA ligase, partial [Eubacteriales bacterium]|nr:aspartate--tRNA ligase [Eubacteriales bacterium]
MSELLQGWKRTKYCAEFTKADVDREVTLMGWVDACRDLGALVFITLRDRTGRIQLTFDSSVIPAELFARAQSFRAEYVLAAKGMLKLRTPEMVNSKMKTGELEVHVTECKLLSRAEPSPIDIEDNTKTNELLRLKYRYLDLRRPVMQKNLRLRHELTQITRNFFAEEGFMEIETPMLTRSTPEGARDYLVPSRVHPGTFYALPQSPQQFKQMLMLSGCDRYMQIARCFRDEDLRADRQPEFTQIDLEMSFVEEDDVMDVNERFLKRVFKELKGIDITLPLPRITWQNAMDRYGSDKPDTRFGLELVNISDIVKNCGFSVFSGAIENGGSVRCINAKGAGSHLSRKDIDALGEFVKTYRAKGLAWANLKPEGIQSSLLK